jgi:hypothetical protein
VEPQPLSRIARHDSVHPRNRVDGGGPASAQFVDAGTVWVPAQIVLSYRYLHGSLSAPEYGMWVSTHHPRPLDFGVLQWMYQQNGSSGAAGQQSKACDQHRHFGTLLCICIDFGRHWLGSKSYWYWYWSILNSTLRQQCWELSSARTESLVRTRSRSFTRVRPKTLPDPDV